MTARDCGYLIFPTLSLIAHKMSIIKCFFFFFWFSTTNRFYIFEILLPHTVTLYISAFIEGVATSKLYLRSNAGAPRNHLSPAPPASPPTISSILQNTRTQTLIYNRALKTNRKQPQPKCQVYTENEV